MCLFNDSCFTASNFSFGHYCWSLPIQPVHAAAILTKKGGLDGKYAVLVQEFYAQKGLFTKQIATEGFSTVFGQLMSPL